VPKTVIVPQAINHLKFSWIGEVSPFRRFPHWDLKCGRFVLDANGKTLESLYRDVGKDVRLRALISCFVILQDNELHLFGAFKNPNRHVFLPSLRKNMNSFIGYWKATDYASRPCYSPVLDMGDIIDFEATSRSLTEQIQYSPQ
jgi:hypothetical protein